MPENIRLQITEDAGAPQLGQNGGVQVTAGSTLQLSVTGATGAKTAKYRIYEYPDGYALPAGWSLDGTAYVVTVANAGPSPTFEAPAAEDWGGFLADVEVDGRTRNGQIVADLYDNTLGFYVQSPSGLPDILYLEAGQFDQHRKWTGALKALVRAVVGVVAGGSVTLLPYRIERALRSGKHLDVSAGNNQDAFFATPDGSRLFIVESGGGPPFGVEQWSLSTPGDLDTATLDGTFEHGLGSVTGIAFNTAGTRMYLVDDTDNVIDQFNIAPENAWDVIADDPTHAGSASVSAQTTAPSGITITPDGTKVIVSSATVLYQYTLSTPGEVIGGSLSFDTSLTLTTRGARWANGFDGTPGGLLIYSTGTALAARNCPTPYSIAGTTAENLATFSPGIGSIPGSSSSNVVDLQFIDDGARMWLLGDNDIFEFHTTAAVPA